MSSTIAAAAKPPPPPPPRGCASRDASLPATCSGGVSLFLCLSLYTPYLTARLPPLLLPQLSQGAAQPHHTQHRHFHPPLLPTDRDEVLQPAVICSPRFRPATMVPTRTTPICCSLRLVVGVMPEAASPSVPASRVPSFFALLSSFSLSVVRGPCLPASFFSREERLGGCCIRAVLGVIYAG